LLPNIPGTFRSLPLPGAAPRIRRKAERKFLEITTSGTPLSRAFRKKINFFPEFEFNRFLTFCQAKKIKI
jgi:hypothetical protein